MIIEVMNEPCAHGGTADHGERPPRMRAVVQYGVDVIIAIDTHTSVEPVDEGHSRICETVDYGLHGKGGGA